MTIIVSGTTTRTTVAKVIKRAMRLAGVIQTNEEPTAQEATDVLEALNSMLDAWSIERLHAYQIYDETVSWASGQQYRTIGDGGNFNTTRPTKILDGFIRVSGVDYIYESIEKPEYDQITQKTVTGIPDRIYYENSAPLGILWAYPVPNQTMEVHLNTLQQLQAFTDMTENLNLPKGHERAIVYNLAVEIAPEFQVGIDPNVQKIAMDSKGVLKTFNRKTIVAKTLFGQGQGFNIYAGE